MKYFQQLKFCTKLKLQLTYSHEGKEPFYTNYMCVGSIGFYNLMCM